MKNKIPPYVIATVAMFVGSLYVKADEYSSSSDDGSTDTITLEPYTVDGNDDATMDYAGAFLYDLQQQVIQDLTNYQDQLSEQEAQQLQQQVQSDSAKALAAELKAFTDYCKKYLDSLDGVMNVLNGVGLISPDKVAAYVKANANKIGGYVISDGQGGFQVVVNVDTIKALYPQLDDTTLAIAIQSVIQHEDQHVVDGLRDNPGLLDTPFAGWALSHNTATLDGAEVSAYDVQLGYLYDQIANNQNLSSSERQALEDFTAGVETSKSNYVH